MKNKLFGFYLICILILGCSKNLPQPDYGQPEGQDTQNVEDSKLYDENGELIVQDLDYFDHERELEEGFKKEEEAPSFDIPIVINKQVEAWIKYFQTDGRKVFKIWLARSAKYIPLMKKILRENGLPEDLIYLSMIESGFKPYAYSRARAVGPWQFIRRTGTRYGLKVDWAIDERRDPEKSTIAAAQHLKDLHDEFNHWYLAAAGYNAGAGKIKRAMQKYSTEDFWEMSKYRYLRRETKNYVPKMIAAALIAKNPEKYGFTDVKYEEPLEYDKVIVPKPTDLKSIANAIGTDHATLKSLNPELLRWFTPPNYPNYELKIPKGMTPQFEAKRAEFKNIMISSTVKHRIRYGETLSHIADAYGTSVRSLLAFNNIRNPRRIRAGKVIHVPVRAQARKRIYKTPADHKLKSGETLTHLALSYGTSVEVLLAANNITDPTKLKPGQIIHVPAKGAPVSKSYLSPEKYVLKSGETLSHVADFYGTSISDLMAYNNIRNPKRVLAGQTIFVPARPKGSTSTTKSRISGIDTETYKKMVKEDGAIGYTVKRGDTLWSISRAFNVTVSEIRKWNNLGSSRMIHPGDKLVMYPRFLNGNGSDSSATEAISKTARFHRVRRGDTLWGIAKEYNISMNKLISLNKLQGKQSIYPGDMIKLVN